MRYYADHPDMTEKRTPYQIGNKPIIISGDQDLDPDLVYGLESIGKALNNPLRFLNATPVVLEFFVPGPARAKQSFKYTGHGHGFTPARVKAWQADVGWAAQQAIHKLDANPFPLSGDIAVNLIFLIKDNRRIDLDNLSKAVLDALNGIAWEDDRQVTDLNLHKTLNAPADQDGVNVLIRKA